MSQPAVDSILDQAGQFTEAIADSYEAEIAAGEVGVGGTGQASMEPILATRSPTPLLYGRVQSGKTAAMVLTAALAFDNGFRIVMVLTADNVELVRQTSDRFRDLDGPRVLSTVELTEWAAAEEELIDDVARSGLVFVCAKNAVRLPQVLRFLQRINAAAYPSIVFDDEADAATPDTTLQARTSGRANAPAHASTINRRVVENTRPGEEGESAQEILTHGMYVQVTATPFVLILQRVSSPLHPTATFLLEPGTGYCGGERFFGHFDSDAAQPPAPPMVLVPDREYLSLNRRPVPPALATSIEFLLVAAAAQEGSRSSWPRGGYKHLSHTSPRVAQHESIADHIERHLGTLRTELRDDPNAALARFGSAYAELQRSLPAAPPLASLMPTITASARQAQVFRINARADSPAYGPRVNFLVGGNILGRGLTIDDLLVTYYLRQAQVSQMDTVLQHARMYGYREALMPYTRVYLPRQLAILFKEIHDSEEALRGIYQRRQRGEDVPIQIARGSRATRPGALEGNERVYEGRLGQVSPHYVINDPDSVREVSRLLAAANVPLAAERDQRVTSVGLDVIRSLVEQLEPRPEDAGRWSTEAVLGLIDVHEEQYNGEGIVYVRAFDKEPEPERTRGRLSGPEIEIIRQASPNVPALVLLYWQTPEDPILWYPTLVLPRDMPTYIFCPS
ncbi:MAG TPA: Z1 domain-containing protein [Pirellulales bacterium]|nr:Z1 domain-containing protein [Pirellulales bacterium]